MNNRQDDGYHERFDELYKRKSFTGRCFTNDQFIHHLNNTNFRYELGEIEKNLSEEGVKHIKNKFIFCEYGVSVSGLDMDSPSYTQDFAELVQKFAMKYPKILEKH